MHPLSQFVESEASMVVPGYSPPQVDRIWLWLYDIYIFAISNNKKQPVLTSNSGS